MKNNNNIFYHKYKKYILIIVMSLLLLTVASMAQPLKPKNVINNSGFQKILPTPIEDFQVNENAGNCNQEEPRIAMDRDGNFVIIWQDKRNCDKRIYAQRYDKNGQPCDSTYQVSYAKGDEPAIGMDSAGNFVITWRDIHRSGVWINDPFIFAQRYDFNENPIGGTFKVNDDHWNAYNWQDFPAIAVNSNGMFVITWYDDRKVDDWREGNIYAQRYNSNGDSLGRNFQVNDDKANVVYDCPPVVGIDYAGNFVIVWGDRRNGNYDIYAQRFNASGDTVGENFRVNDDTTNSVQNLPAIAVNSKGNFVIAWGDYRNGEADIYVQRYDFGGVLIGKNLKANDDEKNSDQFKPVVAIDGSDNFMVIWRDMRNVESESSDIYGQCFNLAHGRIGDNFRINNDFGGNEQNNHALASNEKGRFIAVWSDNRNVVFETYIQMYDSCGQPAGKNFKPNDDIGTSWQMDPAIATDGGGNSVIVWQDYREDQNGDIYAQCFEAGMSKLNANFKVNADPGTSIQGSPAIARDKFGNAVIVWHDTRDGNYDIFGQRFDSEGRPLDNNFKINDDGGNSAQDYPDITIGGNGNFVVVWRDKRNGNYDIYGQYFYNTGKNRGNNFRVNDDSGNNFQEYPAICMAKNGAFVVVWQDNRNGNFDIYGQCYNSSFAKQDTNFIINNDMGIKDQYTPSIDIDDKGAFIVVWKDNRNDNLDIYGQLYTASGTTKNTNFLVNDYKDNTNQNDPVISVDENGYFVIAWKDARNVNTDIYYQLFNNDGNKIGINYKVNNDIGDNEQLVPDVELVNRLIYFTWQDNRIPNQGYDIFARVNLFDNLPPGSPTLLSPANHSFSTNNTPTFTFTVPDDNEGDSLQFKIEVAQDNNFINQIANSPFESQTDTTGFNPKPPLAPGSGNCDYTVQSVLADGTYYWRISAADGLGYGEASAIYNFKVDTTPPYTAEHDPTDNDTNVAINTDIVVHVKDDISGVDSVSIKMKVNEQQVLSTITGTETDYTITYDPPYDFNYTDTIPVSINAQDKAGNVMAPDNYSFTTEGKGNTAPEVPTLISPANNSRTNNMAPTLTWVVPTDVDGDSLHFRLELDDDNDWSTILLIIESKDNHQGFVPTPPVGQNSGNISYELQFELTEGYWWWRASAWDGKVYSPHSEVWKLTITKSQIKVSTSSLDFGDVCIGNSDSLKLIINNVGTDTLIIYDINWTQKSYFLLTNTTGIIPEGSGLDITAIFKPTDEILYTDTLKIYSNDQDEAMVTVIMKGNGIYPPGEITSISVLPNPFTPNSDGYNDYVTFKYPNMKEQTPIIQIFNLKGKKVTELKNFSGDQYLWDGKDNSGRELEPGVYIYILELKHKKTSGGTITLIR